jgi:putative membrane protein
MLYWIAIWFLTSIAFLITSYLVPGFKVVTLGTALWAAALVGILNVVLRPILILLTLPINIITLGLFTFVVNAMVLKLAASLIKGFEISNWTSAIIGAIILTLVHWALFSLLTVN